MSDDMSKPSLISEGLKQFLLRRVWELTGLLIMAVAVLLLVAIGSAHFSDPSAHTASTEPVRNWLGPSGAQLASYLNMIFYLGAPLLAFGPLRWGWKLLRHRPVSRWKLRLFLLPVTVFIMAMGLTGLTGRLSAGDGGFASLAMGHLLVLAGPLPDMLGLSSMMLISAGLLGIGTVVYIYVLALELKHARRLGQIFGWALRPVSKILAAPFLFAYRRLRLSPKAAAKSSDTEAKSKPKKPAAKPKKRTGAKTRKEPTLLPAAQAEAGQEETPARKAASSRQAKTNQTSFDFDPSDGFQLPPHNLLKPPMVHTDGPSEAELQENAAQLEGVLAEYRVEGHIADVQSGPVVTRYDLVPAPGIKSQRVISLADDVARSMAAMAVRMAVVPGQNVIGIELPTENRETVLMRDILDDDIWHQHTGDLPIALGKDIAGQAVVADLAKMPHLLVAGTTGSGKSVGINSMILSLLYRHTPETCRLIMIDPKMLELSVYDGIPHLLTPVVTDPAKAVMALKWAVQEMDNRYRNMSKVGVRNITGYNQKLAEASGRGEVLTRRVQTGFDQETGRPIYEEEVLDMAPLPYIVVIIDEVADLMMVAGKEIDIAVQRLAQKARAAGIHVIMATQRPSVDVITGTIKSNFPTRISFQVASKIDSRTILNEQGAEQLLGRGDMLFVEGGGRVKRVHGPFMGDDEVESVANFLRAQGEPDYDEQVTEEQEEELLADDMMGGAPSATGNSLYDQAVNLVVREQRASTSFVQRHLKIGYNRAATLIEEMEAAGIIGKANHVGKREVLRAKDEE